MHFLRFFGRFLQNSTKINKTTPNNLTRGPYLAVEQREGTGGSSVLPGRSRRRRGCARAAAMGRPAGQRSGSRAEPARGPGPSRAREGGRPGRTRGGAGSARGGGGLLRRRRSRRWQRRPAKGRGASRPGGSGGAGAHGRAAGTRAEAARSGRSGGAMATTVARRWSSAGGRGIERG